MRFRSPVASIEGVTRLKTINGFSLIETLVASAILTGVVLLATSLILRSKLDTLVGRRHSEVSRLAGSSQEELRSLPLDRESLVVPEGRSDLVREALWTRTEEWFAEPSAPDAIWRRATRVRQFSVADLDDRGTTAPATLDSPLPGGTDPRQAHLRVIEVVVGTEGPGPPGAGGPTRLTLIAVRAF